MKKKHNYAAITLLIIAVTIVGIAGYLGTLQPIKMHLDENTQPIQKNITILSKQIVPDGYEVTDTNNTTYLTSERASAGMSLNKTYHVAVQSYNNNTGYWILTYQFMQEPVTKRPTPAK